MAAVITPAPRRPVEGSTGDEAGDPTDPTAPGYELEPEASPPPRTDLPTMSREDEQQLVNHVRQLFFRARDKRRHIIASWTANYKALHMRQWSPHRAAHLPKVEVPEIFPIIDAIVSWVTDRQPTFDAAPAVSPLNPWFRYMSELADDLTTVVRATWQVDKFDPEIEQTVWDGYTYGVGYLKTVWDRGAFKGYGNAVMRRVDPYAIYPDPDATSPKDANHIIEARTISRQELERRFPGSLERLADGFFTEDVDKAPTRMDANTRTTAPMANPGAIAPATGSPGYGLPGQDSRSVHVTDDPGVTYIEAWLRTPYTPTASEDDDQATYDTWRCVVVAGNRVLMDCLATEMWSHGQHPYDRYVPMETGEWYGKSMVEMLMPAQRSINKILAATEHNIDLMGNPVFVEQARAGLSRTQITNKPGERLVLQQGDAKWMDPPQMHPQIASDLVRFLIQEMERISGLSAVVRGASPTGRNAEGVIDAMQEAAFVRIRKALRNLSHTISSSGDKLASMIVEFYDVPRMVLLAGPSGEKTALTLRTKHFYDPSTEGRVPARFQLLVNAGENANLSLAQEKAEADALFALGAIDEEALLEVHRFPNWYRVVDRVREAKAQAGTMGMPPTQRAAARR